MYVLFADEPYPRELSLYSGLCQFNRGCRGFPHSSVGKESTWQCRRPWFDSWVGKIHWRRDRLATPVFLGFPCGSAGKESACNVGDLGSVPGLGRSPGEGKGYALQYSGLENSMDCTVHGVAKSQTRLSDFHFHWASRLNLEWPEQLTCVSMHSWTHVTYTVSEE